MSFSKLMDNRSQSYFARTDLWRMIILVVILLSGLTTRLYDLTDPPLDYAPSRQLRSAIIARGIYSEWGGGESDLEREIAIRQKAGQEMLEPRILENIVALGYLISGGEYVWIARIFSALFWMVGGLFLYDLVRKHVSGDAGVIALFYYSFAPFGLLASRTFQPDPLMTGLIIISWWAFLRWTDQKDWKGAIITGLITGFAILVKLPAVFFLFFGMAAVLLTEIPFKALIRNTKVWVIGLLSVIPAAIYQVYGYFISEELKGLLSGRLFNSSLWIDPGFYLDWLKTSSKVAGHLVVFLLALAALLLIQSKKLKRFLIGGWIGFIIYGFGFSYYVTTHSYYLLPLIPLAAISLGAGGHWILSRIQSKVFTRLVWVGLGVLVLMGVAGGFYIYQTEDYRHEPGYYQKVADYVSEENSIIALSQDYGFRLAYYGRIVVQPWSKLERMAPDHINLDQISYGDAFAITMEDFDYFIITSMKEFRRQTDLKQELTDHYPVFIEGEGYTIFNLQERWD